MPARPSSLLHLSGNERFDGVIGIVIIHLPGRMLAEIGRRSFYGTGDAAGDRAGTIRDGGRMVLLLPIDRAYAMLPEG